jgi:hypothetical protein
LQRFAVFIRDPTSTGEFAGLTRIDTEAEDEAAASDRAVRLYNSFGASGGGPFTDEDVALCARLSDEAAPEGPAPDRRGGSVRMF